MFTNNEPLNNKNNELSINDPLKNDPLFSDDFKTTKKDSSLDEISVQNQDILPTEQDLVSRETIKEFLSDPVRGQNFLTYKNSLVTKFMDWGTKNHIDVTLEHFENFNKNFNVANNIGTTVSSLYRQGLSYFDALIIHLSNDKIDLDKRKSIVIDLLKRGLQVCPDGITDNLQTSCIKLTSSIRGSLMNIRRALSEQVIRDTLNRYKPELLSNPAMEIHTIKKFIHDNNDILFLDLSNDSYEASVQASDEIGEKCRSKLSEKLTSYDMLNAITNPIALDQRVPIDDMLLDLDNHIQTKNTTEIDKCIAQIESLLNFYGEDEMFSRFCVLNYDDSFQPINVRPFAKQFILLSLQRRLINNGLFTDRYMRTVELNSQLNFVTFDEPCDRSHLYSHSYIHNTVANTYTPLIAFFYDEVIVGDESQLKDLFLSTISKFMGGDIRLIVLQLETLQALHEIQQESSNNYSYTLQQRIYVEDKLCEALDGYGSQGAVNQTRNHINLTKVLTSILAPFAKDQDEFVTLFKRINKKLIDRDLPPYDLTEFSQLAYSNPNEFLDFIETSNDDEIQILKNLSKDIDATQLFGIKASLPALTRTRAYILSKWSNEKVQFPRPFIQGYEEVLMSIVSSKESIADKTGIFWGWMRTATYVKVDFCIQLIQGFSDQTVKDAYKNLNEVNNQAILATFFSRAFGNNFLPIMFAFFNRLSSIVKRDTQYEFSNSLSNSHYLAESFLATTVVKTLQNGTTVQLNTIAFINLLKSYSQYPDLVSLLASNILIALPLIRRIMHFYQYPPNAELKDVAGNFIKHFLIPKHFCFMDVTTLTSISQMPEQYRPRFPIDLTEQLKIYFTILKQFKLEIGNDENMFKYIKSILKDLPINSVEDFYDPKKIFSDQLIRHKDFPHNFFDMQGLQMLVNALATGEHSDETLDYFANMVVINKEIQFEVLLVDCNHKEIMAKLLAFAIVKPQNQCNAVNFRQLIANLSHEEAVKFIDANRNLVYAACETPRNLSGFLKIAKSKSNDSAWYKSLDSACSNHFKATKKGAQSSKKSDRNAKGKQEEKPNKNLKTKNAKTKKSNGKEEVDTNDDNTDVEYKCNAGQTFFGKRRDDHEDQGGNNKRQKLGVTTRSASRNSRA